MEYKPISIAFRIEWCQRKKTQARVELEREGWQAEEEGLRDALLKRDHTNQYRHYPPAVFKRYVMGFEDGQALIQAAEMGQHLPNFAQRTHA